jgi:hypothetical protein
MKSEEKIKTKEPQQNQEMLWEKNCKKGYMLFTDHYCYYSYLFELLIFCVDDN